jgi:DNA adenine methylase
MTVRAPFPWFGGKRRVAPIVWQAFGAEINNYVEPFAGSLAVLLGRPGGAGKIETVNDLDRYVANFWRAVSADPDAVARHADWPVNEADLHARHRWLVNQAEFRERMHVDPDFFDVKIAGWWVWGLCQWIGGGWCSGLGWPHTHRLVADAFAPGRMPVLSGAGQGVHLPGLGNDRGINGVGAPPCGAWFRTLQVRLRRVRVACGDWKRVLGPSVLGKGKNVGGRRPCAVFLDPPYDPDLRAGGMYAEDQPGLSAEVHAWALEHGDDPDLRIALCGYEGEHEMPPSWTEYSWQAARGYAAEDNHNREKERIWFSPHCIPLQQQGQLFA